MTIQEIIAELNAPPFPLSDSAIAERLQVTKKTVYNWHSESGNNEVVRSALWLLLIEKRAAAKAIKEITLP